MPTWNFASENGKIGLELNASDNGNLTGSMTYTGIKIAPGGPNQSAELFNVSGSWVASGSLPGRESSAFIFCGNNGKGSAPTNVAVCGVMFGSGPAPSSIEIRGSMSSGAFADGNLQQFRAKMEPTAVVDIVKEGTGFGAPLTPRIGHKQRLKAVCWHNLVSANGEGENVNVVPGKIDGQDSFQWDTYFSNGPNESGPLPVKALGYSEPLIWNKKAVANPTTVTLNYHIKSGAGAPIPFDVDPEVEIDEC